MIPQEDRYAYYRSVFKNVPMPFAFVDLDCFDENIRAIRARAGGKPVRVASKSIRCVSLLRRIQAASTQFQSVMAYGVREAVFLARKGFDDILVAYPAWRDAEVSDICGVLREGKTVTLAVDCVEHAEHLGRIGEAGGVVIPVCMDVDMSVRYPFLHFGVRRSGVSTPDQAVALWNSTRKLPNVSLTGVLGYEAQIASLQDNAPGGFIERQALRLLKRHSVLRVEARRAAVCNALREAGCPLRFVNGGGTGSVETTLRDNTVTEITVGSGFYAPALFDHFERFRHLPALGFAVEIVRRPAPGIYTCNGGGYIASGSAGSDRLPVPYLPQGFRLTRHEGAGEVQTPVLYRGPENMEIGDPIFMRPGKGGELCERFSSLLLVSQGRVVDEVPTYRGDGQCFP